MLPLLAHHRQQAAALLPADVVQYYAGGAGDQLSVVEAETAWRQVRLTPRVLRDVSSVDASCTLLGHALQTPILIAPSAAHGLAHPEAERATAAGAHRADSLLVLSCRSTLPPAEVSPQGPWWHQAYVFTDRDQTWRQAENALRAGASAIVLTGDVPWLGQRHGPTRRQLAGADSGTRDTGTRDTGTQDPTAGLEVIAQLRRRTGLAVLVKGVLHPDDATDALDAGAAGVIVSNHGGRQLDRAVSTARALTSVVAAIGGRAPVLVDGGLRSGLDVLCAFALGADAVLIGRPVLWALAVGGADGVASCLTALREDLVHQMGLAGATTLADLRCTGEFPR